MYYFLEAVNPYQERAWISSIKPDGRELDLYTRYGSAIYWPLTTFTTVGYGDLHVENANKKLFSSIHMLLSFFFLLTLLGTKPKLSRISSFRLWEFKKYPYLDIQKLDHNLLKS